jgi:cation transport ATPase
MRRLVESWVQAEKELHGNNLAAAIKLLNETNESKVTHSRVSEWRRGVYAPSQVALSFMLYRVLPWALKQAGLEVSDSALEEIERHLWIVEYEGGSRYIETM